MLLQVIHLEDPHVEGQNKNIRHAYILIGVFNKNYFHTYLSYAF